MINTAEIITVFTATYNRSNLLQRLFVSLKEQTNKNFEWVIVDDGSTDETFTIIEKIQKEANFRVIYKKQENQGKHIAINTGVALANGQYFFIVDSDDRLPKDAIAIVFKKLLFIKENSNVAGIVGLKCYFNKKTVGFHPLKEDKICDFFDYRYTYKVQGDRAEVLKTSIFKKYPFPKFGNEKFVPESIVWNRIAKDYKMLFFNENIYECEYLEDGLSAQSVRLRRQNPKGIINLYAELGKIKKIGSKGRIKAYINFWRFFFCDLTNGKSHLKRIKNQYFAFLCIPFGFALYVKDGLTL